VAEAGVIQGGSGQGGRGRRPCCERSRNCARRLPPASVEKRYCEKKPSMVEVRWSEWRQQSKRT
jgi:hypothetical protein